MKKPNFWVVAVPILVPVVEPTMMLAASLKVWLPEVREAKEATPAPVTDHWASLRTRSEPEDCPMVMIPPVVLPMVIAVDTAAVPMLMALALVLDAPILMLGVPAVDDPTSNVILPAVPAEAFPVVIATAPVEVVPVPVEILFAPEAPAEALPVVIVTPPVPPATALVSTVRAVLAVVAPDRRIKLEEVPEVDQVLAAPPVKVKAAPDVKEEAPALDEPMVMRSAPAVPILRVSTPAAVEPAILIV